MNSCVLILLSSDWWAFKTTYFDFSGNKWKEQFENSSTTIVGKCQPNFFPWEIIISLFPFSSCKLVLGASERFQTRKLKKKNGIRCNNKQDENRQILIFDHESIFILPTCWVLISQSFAHIFSFIRNYFLLGRMTCDHESLDGGSVWVFILTNISREKRSVSK